MGWWSSLWNGAKAVAEVATKAVTTVARATAKAVTTVARATAKAVTTVARATAKAVTTVARATTKAVTTVARATEKAMYKLATTPPIQTLGAILYVGAVVTGFALGVLASAIVPGVLLDRLREFLQPVPSEPG
ncbi:Hypothetical protein NTJ_13810 [Nesidiocoris tenuis]|uniref:Uncharacterized protein n=1 Tax=Nesidiocoris tenuis TaxID=355587 RepID=A0ABN7B9D3_9HEMI|nr:Hypothetical protein NTJ_13810 [Nesidiocoris tenuis]